MRLNFQPVFVHYMKNIYIYLGRLKNSGGKTDFCLLHSEGFEILTSLSVLIRLTYYIYLINNCKQTNFSVFIYLI